MEKIFWYSLVSIAIVLGVLYAIVEVTKGVLSFIQMCNTIGSKNLND